MQTFCLTAILCAGQKPRVLIRDFPNICDATDFAFQQWPTAIKLSVKPVDAACQKET